MHTDSLTVYKTELQIISTEEGEGNEIHRPIVRASKVIEQRVSHFLMGLGIIATMTCGRALGKNSGVVGADTASGLCSGKAISGDCTRSTK